MDCPPATGFGLAAFLAETHDRPTPFGVGRS